MIAYGMKIPYGERDYIDCLEGPSQGRRFDVGRNINGSVIPLLSISERFSGILYPMLGNTGAGCRSVTLKMVTGISTIL